MRRCGGCGLGMPLWIHCDPLGLFRTLISPPVCWRGRKGGFVFFFFFFFSATGVGRRKQCRSYLPDKSPMHIGGRLEGIVKVGDELGPNGVPSFKTFRMVPRPTATEGQLGKLLHPLPGINKNIILTLGCLAG